MYSEVMGRHALGRKSDFPAVGYSALNVPQIIVSWGCCVEETRDSDKEATACRMQIHQCDAVVNDELECF
jgi:hypothetical protein